MAKKRLLLPGLTLLLLASVAGSAPGCNSSGSSANAGAGAGGDGNSNASGASSNAPGDAGAAGAPEGLGGADSTGPAGDAGAPGSAGSLGDAGAPSTSTAAALPTSTFLYVYSETPDADQLIAADLQTGKQRVVTDLRGDGSDGWEIWGAAISPDRRRIAVASLFDPTDEDVATKLATRRIWTFNTDGGDFQRLTPVFENTGAGRKNFTIEVEDPAFSADGSSIIYDFGNWWYEGTTLEGGSLPWLVSTSGNDLPGSFPTISSCTVIQPSVNPATGDVLFIHSVCVSSADEGIFLYPADGGTAPVKLVAKGYGAGQVDPSLETPSWVGDGSGFVFVGGIEVTRGANTETANSLLAYDMTTGDILPLVIPEPNTRVQSGAISADGNTIVYCLSHDDVYDLHLIDLTQDPLEDVPITDDGKSCHPVF